MSTTSKTPAIDVKFVSLGDMWRWAMAECDVIKRNRIYVEYWGGLPQDRKEYLDTVGYMLSPEVRFGTISIGNCGTTCVTNIALGNDVTRPEPLVSREAYKPVLTPSFLKDAWGSFDGKHLSVKEYFCQVSLTHHLTSNPEPLVRSFGNKILTVANSAVITDCVNRRSGYRSATAPSFDTAYFMDIVEKSKIGYLVKSPISFNHSHNRKGDLSIIRHWIYYPEGSVVMKADKYLGSGAKIASSPSEFVAGFNSRLDNWVKGGNYSRQYVMDALANWRKGGIFADKSATIYK